jgi:hypothetical protein
MEFIIDKQIGYKNKTDHFVGLFVVFVYDIVHFASVSAEEISKKIIHLKSTN